MRIEKRNNKAYLYESDIDWMNPRLITSFWLINIDASILPDNSIPEKFVSGYIVNTGYKILPLNISEYPTFTEFTPIKPPKKSGYKWLNGKWIKL